ncbi:hypothetical protein TNCT_406641 [Trichonephila clavata]|uniref:Uncharacterized protein n=1 Tax=Trichonephila clavata TaxID=2740835 RepID=A0A8X6HYS7_TRICU|nr:hypothetical protein TNCT_406641 [Trichonephila clavata]
MNSKVFSSFSYNNKNEQIISVMLTPPLCNQDLMRDHALCNSSTPQHSSMRGLGMIPSSFAFGDSTTTWTRERMPDSGQGSRVTEYVSVLWTTCRVLGASA